MTTPLPPPSAIRYAEDEFGVSTWPAWLDVQDARAARAGQAPPPRPLGEAPGASPVTAVMNYARWIARCECGAAAMLFRGTPGAWFWCPACGNAATGGMFRPVTWPANRTQIDADKGSLPTALANWDPAAEAERQAIIDAQRASAGTADGGHR